MSVDLSVESGLAEIVLNRPDKMNALNDAMVAELNGCLERAAADGVRAMMIRGEGPAFSAGRDLADADPGNEDAEAIIETTFNPLIKRIVAFPAPTFAAVHGACLGVGLGLALGCDVVYAADDAKIGSPFARIGAVLDSGGHSFFVSRLGTHRALELIYTGRLLSGAEAAQLWSQDLPLDSDIVRPRLAACPVLWAVIDRGTPSPIVDAAKRQGFAFDREWTLNRSTVIRLKR